MSKEKFKDFLNTRLEDRVKNLDLKSTENEEVTEDKEDDEMLRIDVANAFISKFADEFAFNRAALQSQLVGKKQLIKVSIGKGTRKIFAGQLIVEYQARDKYKISRYDGLFQTADMKKWATKAFDRVFKDEIKKGNIR